MFVPREIKQDCYICNVLDKLNTPSQECCCIRSKSSQSTGGMSLGSVVQFWHLMKKSSLSGCNSLMHFRQKNLLSQYINQFDALPAEEFLHYFCIIGEMFNFQSQQNLRHNLHETQVRSNFL